MNEENFEVLMQYFVNKIEELANKVGKQTEQIRSLTLERNEARVELKALKTLGTDDKPIRVRITKND